MGKSTGTWSASKGVVVTVSDATILPATRGLFVGTGGDVAVIFSEDSAAKTLKNVASGTTLPVQVTKVMSTNTTASDIVALY